MKKNIIVVTGGAGFIGSALIKYFVENKFKEKIISIDNLERMMNIVIKTLFILYKALIYSRKFPEMKNDFYFIFV